MLVLRTRHFDRHLKYFLMKSVRTCYKAKECVLSSGVEGLLNFLFSIKTLNVFCVSLLSFGFCAIQLSQCLTPPISKESLSSKSDHSNDKIRILS